MTIARLNNIPDSFIQQITGHESLEMIDHYTHFTPDDIASLTQQLPQAQKTNLKRVREAPDLEKVKSLVSTMTKENWAENRDKIMGLLNT